MGTCALDPLARPHPGNFYYVVVTVDEENNDFLGFSRRRNGVPFNTRPSSRVLPTSVERRSFIVSLSARPSSRTDKPPPRFDWMVSLLSSTNLMSQHSVSRYVHNLYVTFTARLSSRVLPNARRQRCLQQLRHERRFRCHQHTLCGMHRGGVRIPRSHTDGLQCHGHGAQEDCGRERVRGGAGGGAVQVDPGLTAPGFSACT